MKQGFIKVAASSIHLQVADVEHNVKVLLDRLMQAKQEGVHILVLPELCVTAASCGDLFFQASLLDAAENALISLAKATSGCDMISVIGLPVRFAGRLYNAAAVLQDGRILGIVPKDDVDDSARQFASASNLPQGAVLTLVDHSVPFGQDLVFESKYVSFAVALGDELCRPFSRAEQAAADALILLNPAACQAYMDGGKERRQQLLSLTSRLHCACVSASADYSESTQDQVIGDYHLIAENGNPLAEHLPFTKGEMLISEIDTELLLAERRKNRLSTLPAFRRIRFSQIERKTLLTRTFDCNPFLPVNTCVQDYAERILTIQAYGLKKRIEHTHSKTAVIGISGGLDSTLALLATVRTFDLLDKSRSDIRAVTLPCFGTSERTKNNALLLCKALGVTLEEIPIGESVLLHFRDIGHDSAIMDVTYENSQARERTQVLMDLANRYQGLVIGTGDMSELALGWATYNGDHMSMYGLNASIPKTLVRTVVAYEAERLGNPIKDILTDILDTPVSPELLPADQQGRIAQKTEDLVGPYELHDFFLYHFLRYGFSPTKLYRIAQSAFNGIYDGDTIKKWLSVFLRRFVVSQFKRSCLPDGPSISALSLSPRRAWQMPSDASYSCFLSETERLVINDYT